jgi:hypothetical protein
MPSSRLPWGTESFGRKYPLRQEPDARFFLLKAILPAEALSDSC